MSNLRRSSWLVIVDDHAVLRKDIVSCCSRAATWRCEAEAGYRKEAIPYVSSPALMSC